MTVIEITETPNLTGLFVRGALTGPGRRSTRLGSLHRSTLPGTTIVHRGITLDPDHVARYATVCGFAVGDTLPVSYLHVLAFPLSIQLMADRAFPYALAGMLHLTNRITHRRPVRLGEVVDLQVRLDNLRPHAKGNQFDVLADATVDDEPVWSGLATYLKRGTPAGEPNDEPDPTEAVDMVALPLTSVWRVPADQGRRYGAASGDRNPIHLSALTARPFGFPKAIVHGMWTKARALAALEGRLPDTVTVDVAFKRPVTLPSTVEYASREHAGNWQFAVRSRGGTPHLAGLAATP